MVGWDPASGLDGLARFESEVAGDEEEVDSDDGDALLAIIENGCAGFAEIVEGAVVILAVATGGFHAEVGSDVAFGEAGFEHGGWDGHGWR